MAFFIILFGILAEASNGYWIICTIILCAQIEIQKDLIRDFRDRIFSMAENINFKKQFATA